MNIKKRELYWAGLAMAVVAAALVIYFALKNFHVISGGIGTFMRALTPFVYGAVLAYLLLPCYNLFVKLFERKIKKDSLAKGLAVVVCLIFLLILLFIIAGYILPELVISIYEVAQNTAISQNAWAFISWLDELIAENPEMQTRIHAWAERAYDYVANWVKTDFLGDVTKIAGDVASGAFGVAKVLMNLFVGVVVMIYIFMDKNHFVAQTKKLCYSIFPTNAANTIIEKTRFANQAFGGFISGKILESAIIGVIGFVLCFITGMPYPLLLAVIIGVTNLIPFFGPFIGAVPTGLLVVLVEPFKLAIFVVIILVIQFLDNYVLGPKILSGSTGLNSFWVLFAILIGGGLFGFVGMLIGVPVFAVIYNIISSAVNYFLGKKGLSKVTADYEVIEKVDPQSKKFVGEVEV